MSGVCQMTLEICDFMGLHYWSLKQEPAKREESSQGGAVYKSPLFLPDTCSSWACAILSEVSDLDITCVRCASCWERLWMLSPWRCARPGWMGPSAIWSSTRSGSWWPACGRRIGTRSSSRSRPTQAILWSYVPPFPSPQTIASIMLKAVMILQVYTFLFLMDPLRLSLPLWDQGCKGCTRLLACPAAELGEPWFCCHITQWGVWCVLEDTNTRSLNYRSFGWLSASFHSAAFLFLTVPRGTARFPWHALRKAAVCHRTVCDAPQKAAGRLRSLDESRIACPGWLTRANCSAKITADFFFSFF